MNNKRVVFLIGGHITPLIATYTALISQGADANYMVVGRRYALEGSNTTSEEYRLVESLGLPFLPLTTGRLTRVFGVSTIYSLLKLPIGFIQAFYYCIKYKPRLVVSFGGYLAIPVVISSWCLRIPSVTHEQTVSMGLSNRILRFFVRKVLLSFDNSGVINNKTVVTGLPLRKELYHPPDKPDFKISPDFPIIYITGGSTGSTSINSVVFNAVPKLTERFIIVHQTGRLDYNKSKEVIARLPELRKSRYIVQAYYAVSDISWLLHHCAMVVGRSGANTVAEIKAVGAIALFIPLPWAGDNEQYNNARNLVNLGTAKILPQTNLTKETLIQEINCIYDHAFEMKKMATQHVMHQSDDPSTRIAREVISLMT